MYRRDGGRAMHRVSTCIAAQRIRYLNPKSKKIMATTTLTGKEIRALGYPEGRAIGAAVRTMKAHYKGKSKKAKLKVLKNVFQYPHNYVKDEVLGVIARELIAQTEAKEQITLNAQRKPYPIYGEEHIEPGAQHQMEVAMKLPITVAGALMPDAHQGYGSAHWWRAGYPKRGHPLRGGRGYWVPDVPDALRPPSGICAGA